MSFSPSTIECGQTENLAVEMTLPPEWTDGSLVFVEPDGGEGGFIEVRRSDLEQLEGDRHRLLIDSLSGCRAGTYRVELRDESGTVQQSADLTATASQ